MSCRKEAVPHGFYSVPFEDKCITHIVAKGKKHTLCGQKVAAGGSVVSHIKDFGRYIYDCPICMDAWANTLEKGKNTMSENVSQKKERCSWRQWFGQWSAWFASGLRSGKFLLRCFKMRNEIAELFSADFPELYERDEIVQAAVIRRVQLADALARKLTPEWAKDEWVTEKTLNLVRDPEKWRYIRYCLDNIVIPIFYRGNLIAEGPGLRLRAVLPEMAEDRQTRGCISTVVMVISVIRFLRWLRGKKLPGDTLMTPEEAVEYNLQLGLDASATMMPAGALPAPMIASAPPPKMRPAGDDLVTGMSNEESGMKNDASELPVAPPLPYLTGKARELAETLIESPRKKTCLAVSTAILEVCRRASLIPEKMPADTRVFREQTRMHVRLALGVPLTTENRSAVNWEKLSGEIAKLIEEENPETLPQHIEAYVQVANGLALVTDE